MPTVRGVLETLTPPNMTALVLGSILLFGGIIRITPEVLVQGAVGEAAMNDALAATILRQQLQTKPAAAAK